MLPYGSGILPSAPHTGQVACTTSGAPMPAAHRIFAPTLLLWFREPIALPLGFLCPECLDPFPLSSGFPDALDGRDSVGYYGSAAPTRALVTSPLIP